MGGGRNPFNLWRLESAVARQKLLEKRLENWAEKTNEGNAGNREYGWVEAKVNNQ
jgi:hypothetical protein